MGEKGSPVERAEVSLADAAKYMREGCRIVLPGIQALFGFQLVAVFETPVPKLLTPAAAAGPPKRRHPVAPGRARSRPAHTHSRFRARHREPGTDPRCPARRCACGRTRLAPPGGTSHLSAGLASGESSTRVPNYTAPIRFTPDRHG